jgi:hypothetical protein
LQIALLISRIAIKVKDGLLLAENAEGRQQIGKPVGCAQFRFFGPSA